MSTKIKYSCIGAGFYGVGMQFVFNSEYYIVIYSDCITIYKEQKFHKIPNNLLGLSEEEIFQESLNDIYNLINIKLLIELQKIYSTYSKTYDKFKYIPELEGKIIEYDSY